MLSLDPSKTRIVLIGSTKSESDPINLPALPAVANNIEALKRIFADGEIVGVDSSCIETIIDPQNAPQLLVRLARIARQAEDTLVVYYAGHGMKSFEENGLFLCTLETTQEESHLNGVEFNRIRQIIFGSPAAKKILIFDCCYSGEINSEEMGGSAESLIASNIKIKGTYSIASGPRNRLSYSFPGDRYTGFSGELINVLENGIPENVEYLTLNRIYELLKARIASNPRLPSPTRKMDDEAAEIVLARNAGWSSLPEIRIKKIEEKYRKQLAEANTRGSEIEQQLRHAEEREAAANNRLAGLEEAAKHGYPKSNSSCDMH
jgi:uncharacterized caspase-like protein